MTKYYIKIIATPTKKNTNFTEKEVYCYGKKETRLDWCGNVQAFLVREYGYSTKASVKKAFAKAVQNHKEEAEKYGSWTFDISIESMEVLESYWNF